MFIESLSTDVLTVVLLFLLFLISLKFGRKFLLALILSTYGTVLIFNNLSYIDFSNSLSGLITFFVVAIIISLIIWPNLHVKNALTRLRRFFDYFILSLIYVVFLVSLSNNAIYYLDYIFADSGFIHLFVSKIPYFISIILPILGILITNKRNRY